MTFKQAVANTPGLESAYRPGLQALRGADQSRVRCKATRQLTGSVDLDTAFAVRMPNEARWDYGIGFEVRAASEKVFWIEVHDANSHHVSEVLAKLAWLKDWLANTARELGSLPCEFVWIASGRVGMQPGSPQRRRVAAQGLRFEGRRLLIQ
jgi:hypothetical protein